MTKARCWVERGAETGDIDLLFEYAASLSRPENTWGYKVNYIKSHALMSLMLELNGGGDILKYAESELKKTSQHMTPAQLEESKKFSEHWKLTHPPLSFFPDKLGY